MANRRNLIGINELYIDNIIPSPSNKQLCIAGDICFYSKAKILLL